MGPGSDWKRAAETVSLAGWLAGFAVLIRRAEVISLV
jgi:hypothetical protein